MKCFSARFARFLAVGAANTLIGYGLFLVANGWMDYRWAYTVSYAAGIAISYVLNSWLVFHARLSWRNLLRFPVVYAVQYAAGLALIWWLVDGLGVPEAIAPLAVVALTLPLTYALSRYILLPRTRS